MKSHFLLILLHDLPSSRKRLYSNICWWSLVFIHIWKWELEESVMNPLYIVSFIGRENSLQENGQSSSFGVATYLLGIFFWVCYIFPEKGRFSNLAELQRLGGGTMDLCRWRFPRAVFILLINVYIFTEYTSFQPSTSFQSSFLPLFLSPECLRSQIQFISETYFLLLYWWGSSCC